MAEGVFEMGEMGGRRDQEENINQQTDQEYNNQEALDWDEEDIAPGTTTQETSLVEGNASTLRPGATIDDVRLMLVENEVDKFYDEIEKFDGLSPVVKDLNIFSIENINGKNMLYVNYKGKKVRLTKLISDKTGRQFLAPSSLTKDGIGRDFIRYTLGLENYKISPTKQLLEEAQVVLEDTRDINFNSEEITAEKFGVVLSKLQNIGERYKNFDPEGVLSKYEPREISSYIKKKWT